MDNYVREYNEFQFNKPQDIVYQKDYSPPKRKFLEKDKFLSEFKSEQEKETARKNLGLLGRGKDFKYEDFTPEQLKQLTGPKGQDGTVTFEELTESQLAKLMANSVVEQRLDPGSYNAIASRIVYKLYQDLLNSFKNVQTNVDNLLNSKIETIKQSPILFVTEDEYNSLINTGSYNSQAIYAVIEKPVIPPSSKWTFGGKFPIIFGKQNKGFKFGETFPITFN